MIESRVCFGFGNDTIILKMLDLEFCFIVTFSAWLWPSPDWPVVNGDGCDRRTQRKPQTNLKSLATCTENSFAPGQWFMTASSQWQFLEHSAIRADLQAFQCTTACVCVCHTYCTVDTSGFNHYYTIQNYLYLFTIPKSLQWGKPIHAWRHKRSIWQALSGFVMLLEITLE